MGTTNVDYEAFDTHADEDEIHAMLVDLLITEEILDDAVAWSRKVRGKHSSAIVDHYTERQQALQAALLKIFGHSGSKLAIALDEARRLISRDFRAFGVEL
jgi:hypothetical protein